MNTSFLTSAFSSNANLNAPVNTNLAHDNAQVLAFEKESLELDLLMAELDSGISKLEQLDNHIMFHSEYETRAASKDVVTQFLNRSEELRESLGISVPITLSMEDFSGTDTDSIAAMSASLSGIKDMAVNGWNALIDFLKDLYSKIAVFLTKLMDGMPALKKKAEAMKEKADGLSGSAENAKVKFSSVASLMNTGNKDVVLNDFTTNLPKLFNLESVSGLITLAKASNFEKLEGSKEEIEALKPTDLKISDGEIDKVQDGLSDIGPGDDLKEARAIGRENDAVKGITELPGGKAYVVAVAPNHGKDASAGNEALTAALKRVSSIKFGIRSEKKDPKFDKSKEVKTLTPAEMGDICDTIITGCDAFERTKGGIEDGRKAVQKLTKVADKLKNNAGKKDYNEVKSTLNGAKSAMTKLANCAGNPHRDIAAYFYTTANAGLAYCEASAKQYK